MCVLRFRAAMIQYLEKNAMFCHGTQVDLCTSNILFVRVGRVLGRSLSCAVGHTDWWILPVEGSSMFLSVLSQTVKSGVLSAISDQVVRGLAKRANFVELVED